MIGEGATSVEEYEMFSSDDARLTIGAGHVVERWSGSHGTLQEALAGLEAIGTFLHADGAAGADDENPGLWIVDLRRRGGRIPACLRSGHDEQRGKRNR